MKRTRSIALICSGQVSRSALVRLPRLVEHLGWVKAASIRVASRAANSLGGGVPVDDYKGLEEASVIMISVPPKSVRSTVSELAHVGLRWMGKTVVVFDSPFDSGVLESLARFGASVASLNPIADRFVLEGNPEAVRLLRRLLQDRRTRFLEIQQGRLSELLAGVDVTSNKYMSLVAGALDHFVDAGLSKAESEWLAALLFENTRKLYYRAGRRVLKP